MNELPQNIQVKTESVQNIADSIRAKNHSNQKYKIGEMSGAIDDMKVAIPNTMLTIEHNGVYDVSTDEKVSVEVPLPSGSVTLTSNGTHDVTQYVSADVQVPEPTGTIGIGTNGTFNVKDYEFADVNIPTPSGSITITENGTHTVTNYVQAIVNVPVPIAFDNLCFQGTQLSTQTSIDSFMTFLSKIDWSTISNVSNMFKNVYLQVGGIYKPFTFTFPSSFKPTNCTYMFYYSRITSVTLFDTSLSTSLANMFDSSMIQDVPIFDVSSLQTSNAIKGMFANCTSLTQSAIDNIIQMCINCSFTDNIRIIFGSNYPTGAWQKIQDSQYYQDLLNSGWTVS